MRKKHQRSHKVSTTCGVRKEKRRFGNIVGCLEFAAPSRRIIVDRAKTVLSHGAPHVCAYQRAQRSGMNRSDRRAVGLADAPDAPASRRFAILLHTVRRDLMRATRHTERWNLSCGKIFSIAGKIGGTYACEHQMP
jgi:hypothetical protein